jgi:hypothetical protein
MMQLIYYYYFLKQAAHTSSVSHSQFDKHLILFSPIRLFSVLFGLYIYPKNMCGISFDLEWAIMHLSDQEHPYALE